MHEVTRELGAHFSTVSILVGHSLTQTVMYRFYINALLHWTEGRRSRCMGMPGGQFRMTCHRGHRGLIDF